jgi:hypothetical protein
LSLKARRRCAGQIYQRTAAGRVIEQPLVNMKRKKFDPKGYNNLCSKTVSSNR